MADDGTLEQGAITEPTGSDDAGSGTTPDEGSAPDQGTTGGGSDTGKGITDDGFDPDALTAEELENIDLSQFEVEDEPGETPAEDKQESQEEKPDEEEGDAGETEDKEPEEGKTGDPLKDTKAVSIL